MGKTKQKIYGYKAFKLVDGKLMCREFVYEIGKTYTHKGEIQICGSGFHFCDKLVNVYNYYEYEDTVCKVEILGDILTDEIKSVTNKIKILKQVSEDERKCNTGIENSGYSNSGYSNSGDYNSGNRNSGYSNSGNRNSGDYNSGNRNSGYSNSGNRNSDDYNSGNRNSGYSNSGNRNSGNRNSGDYNSGDYNSGCRNSGDYNSTDFETGFFNSKQSEFINVFNKPCKRIDWDTAKKPGFIYNVCVSEFVYENCMSDEEKEQHKDYEIIGGYLKTLSYTEAWEKAYANASKEDKELLKKLPNFDAKVFEEITGIKVNKEIT